MIYPVYIQIAIKMELHSLVLPLFLQCGLLCAIKWKRTEKWIQIFCSVLCVCVIGLNEFRVDSLCGHSPVTDSFTITHYTLCSATTAMESKLNTRRSNGSATIRFGSSKMKGKKREFYTHTAEFPRCLIIQ